VLIYCHGMEPDLNVLAETSVVEPEYRKREIPGQRSESESGRDTVGADRIPNGHALDRARVVEGSSCRESRTSTNAHTATIFTRFSQNLRSKRISGLSGINT
jgi:hypothetical protein